MKGHMQKWFIAICAVALVACFLSPPVFSAEPVIKLKYSNFLPPTMPHSILIDEWCKELEKRTNGRVRVMQFAGQTLTPANQTYDGIVKGITDIGLSILSYSPGRHRLAEAITLPLGPKNGYQASKMANAYYHKFQPKEMDDVKVFYMMGPGPFIWHTKGPINKIEDLKGVRIKSDANTSKIVMAAGGTPVTMSMAETYDGIKRGLADGVLNPIETLRTFKFADVTHYTWENYGGAMTNSFFVAMNKQKWNSLPKDVQAIMEKLNEEYFEKHCVIWNKIDDEGRDFAVKAGHKFIKATPEQEAQMRERMKPVIDKYIADMKGLNLPGEEVVKFLQDYLKTAPLGPGK
jgi:TRAP-type C4-dicarboxylate transport system substrate-binding protein